MSEGRRIGWWRKGCGKGEDVDARDGRDAHGLSVSRLGLQKTLKSRQ